MRISDWSSDVCSSDLHEIEIDGLAAAILTGHLGLSGRLTLGDGRRGHAEAQRKHAGGEEVLQRQRHRGEYLLSPGERTSVVKGKKCVSPCRSRWLPYH